MIKNFETVKQQLNELAGIINSFKSEAVQLRIVELLLSGETDHNDPVNETNGSESGTAKKTGKKKTANPKTTEKGAKKGTASKGRPGPSPTMEKLVGEGFFKKKRTIGDVVTHCNTDLALTYKSTDLSGPLIKMVRDKKLKREKNSETKQYEYINA